MIKTLKTAGIVIVVIIAIPFIVALFTKKKYEVTKEVTIDQPKEQVFEYILLLKNQENFSVWSKMDSDMKTDFRGEDGTVGFVSAWNSDDPDVGSGEQEITGIVPGQRVDYELRFFEPFESSSQAFMTAEALNRSTTRVQWGFSGRMNYPMNLMLLMMDFEGMIGEDLQAGLNNLKVLLEKE